MGTTTATTTAAAGGTTQNNSNFEPTYWQASLLHNYYEISAVPLITKPAPRIRGNKLIYNLASKVQINTGTTENPPTTGWQSLTPKPLEIDMDQLSEWGIEFSDITLFQTNIDLLDGEMIEASQGMDEQISANVYANIFNSAGTKKGAVTVSALTAYDNIVDLGTVLNKNKVPKYGRFVVIDSEYLGLLSKDPRFTFDPHILENGIVEGQKINGMQVIVSEELPLVKNADVGIFAIQKDSFGFGVQFDKTQHFPQLENSWNEAVRGRCLYGRGVLRKEGIVSASVTYNTEIQPNIVD